MSERDTELQVWLEETKLQLATLLGEVVPFSVAMIAPELRSSGKTLAEYYSFVIKAIESGKDPEAYYKVGSAHPNMVKTQYGSHSEDILCDVYQYGLNDKLEVGDSVAVRRLNNLPDYIREEK